METGMNFIHENIKLGISILNLLLSLSKERKSTIRVGIQPYHDSCVYLTRVDNLTCCGLIACRIRITNKSNFICGINNITLKVNGQTYEAVPYEETVVSNYEDIKFIDKQIDAPKYMKVSSENIFNNLQFQPYETRSVYVTFSTSCFDFDKIIYSRKKAKLTLSIANRKFVTCFRIRSVSSRYEQVI